MPKKGQTQPWKLAFQYPEQSKHTRAFDWLPDAVREMLALRKRGASADIGYKSSAGLLWITDEQVIKLLRGLEHGVVEYNDYIEQIETRAWEHQGEEVEG